MADEEVVLRVYDLSNGMARTMSQQLLGMQVDIVPHTGVFVYGREWFFSGGIQSAPTWGMMPMHEEIVLGETCVPLEIFQEFLDGVRDQYTAATYNLATNNCNHFSNAVVDFLAGVQMPRGDLCTVARCLVVTSAPSSAPSLRHTNTIAPSLPHPLPTRYHPLPTLSVLRSASLRSSQPLPY